MRDQQNANDNLDRQESFYENLKNQRRIDAKDVNPGENNKSERPQYASVKAKPPRSRSMRRQEEKKEEPIDAHQSSANAVDSLVKECSQYVNVACAKPSSNPKHQSTFDSRQSGIVDSGDSGKADDPTYENEAILPAAPAAGQSTVPTRPSTRSSFF